MACISIDLGGTKIATGLFDSAGEIICQHSVPLNEKGGRDVCLLMIESYLVVKNEYPSERIDAIGISVPGIYRADTGTVWAPNISGWEDYPLLQEMRSAADGIPVYIDSDRACCVLGEVWKGNAKDVRHAIFLTVGTGIGAGILIDGQILRGAHDIAGAIGWMALQRPYQDKYISCGCFEYSASGDGIARLAKEMLEEGPQSVLQNESIDCLQARHVVAAWRGGDELATKVMDHCVESWGMAAANLVSLFNPETIIFGGGIFGPAIPLIPRIYEEAKKWAQPVSIQKVQFQESALQGTAGLYGAAYLAKQKILDF